MIFSSLLLTWIDFNGLLLLYCIVKICFSLYLSPYCVMFVVLNDIDKCFNLLHLLSNKYILDILLDWILSEHFIGFVSSIFIILHNQLIEWINQPFFMIPKQLNYHWYVQMQGVCVEGRLHLCHFEHHLWKRKKIVIYK